jgi:hypothetical protein
MKSCLDTYFIRLGLNCGLWLEILLRDIFYGQFGETKAGCCSGYSSFSVVSVLRWQCCEKAGRLFHRGANKQHLEAVDT